jgi:OmpA-OmpF porin, OOP family
MGRNKVGPWLMVALLAGAAPVVGCQAHAEFQAAGGQTPPAPTPPPAVPAPATPAPVATAVPTAVAPTPEPPKPGVTMKDGKLSIPGNIVFETDKAIIKPESEPTLNALKDYMAQNPNFTRIRIEGHTDNTGNKDHNLKLSVERAKSVVDWLAQKGVNKDRLLAVGFGDQRPIADNSSDSGKAQNRRTEFHIAEMAGKPYLGRDETNGGTVASGQAPVPVKK